MMMLFRDSVEWRTNKQNMITTSSIKVKLLALSQIIKKVMFLSWLLISFKVQLHEFLIIQCDNAQIIQLIVELFIKLTIKLHHVNIHNHWLWQKHQWEIIWVDWVKSAEMMIDELIKSLERQKFQDFIRMLKMKNITARLTDLAETDANSSAVSFDEVNHVINITLRHDESYWPWFFKLMIVHANQ